MGFNPFKGRQKGQGGAYTAPFGGYNWDQALAALQNDPGMSDRDFAASMGPNALTNQACNDIHRVHKYRAACENEMRRLAALANPPAQPSTPAPNSKPSDNQGT